MEKESIENPEGGRWVLTEGSEKRKKNLKRKTGKNRSSTEICKSVELNIKIPESKCENSIA